MPARRKRPASAIVRAGCGPSSAYLDSQQQLAFLASNIPSTASHTNIDSLQHFSGSLQPLHVTAMAMNLPSSDKNRFMVQSALSGNSSTQFESAPFGMSTSAAQNYQSQVRVPNSKISQSTLDNLLQKSLEQQIETNRIKKATAEQSKSQMNTEPLAQPSVESSNIDSK